MRHARQSKAAQAGRGWSKAGGGGGSTVRGGAAQRMAWVKRARIGKERQDRAGPG